MKKRCVDGCRFYECKYKSRRCLKKNEIIKNSGRYCGEFEEHTFWTKLLNKLTW